MSAIEDAANRFASAAIEKGSEGGPRDHELYEELRSALQVLDDGGESGLEALRQLAKHEAPEARAWAASVLLSRGHSEYEFVLKGLVSLGGMIGFNAEMTLQEWRAGRLKRVL